MSLSLYALRKLNLRINVQLYVVIGIDWYLIPKNIKIVLIEISIASEERLGKLKEDISSRRTLIRKNNCFGRRDTCFHADDVPLGIAVVSPP